MIHQLRTIAVAVLTVLSVVASAPAQTAPGSGGGGAGNGGGGGSGPSGSNTRQQPGANTTPPEPTNDPTPSSDANQSYQQSGGSLARMASRERAMAGGPRGDSSLFAVRPPDPKRVKKFDLITVIVREESDSQTKNNTDLKKTSDFNALLEQYLKFSLTDVALKGREPLALQPQLRFQMERNFQGEGTVDRSDTFSARVQAQVIDVKPNGILIIQATKQIKNDDEEQHFTLTGMVRAEDVTVDNSVLSTQLADLMLEKSTTGAARDASKRGFIPRLIDRINPF